MRSTYSHSSDARRAGAIALACTLLALGSGVSACARETSSTITPEAAPTGNTVDAETSQAPAREILLATSQRPAAPKVSAIATALPDRLRNAPAVFARADFSRVGENGARQRVWVRGAQSVFLGASLHGNGWYFLRNPVHPDRVSALYLDHAQRTILEHDEASLRDQKLGESWYDVLALGLDAVFLGQLAPDTSGTPRLLASYDGQPLRPTADASDKRRVWWNDDLALPLRYEDEFGALEVVEARKVSASEETELLADPRLRYPDYRVIDSVDYLELKHEHQPAGNTSATAHAHH